MFPRNELTSTEGLSPTGLFILRGSYGGCFQGMNSQVQKGWLQQDYSFWGDLMVDVSRSSDRFPNFFRFPSTVRKSESVCAQFILPQNHFLVQRTQNNGMNDELWTVSKDAVVAKRRHFTGIYVKRQKVTTKNRGQSNQCPEREENRSPHRI
jgi:hypothetical protein